MLYFVKKFTSEIKKVILNVDNKKIEIEKFLDGRYVFTFKGFNKFDYSIKVNLDSENDFLFFKEFEEKKSVHCDNLEKKYIEFLFECFSEKINNEVNEIITKKINKKEGEIYNRIYWLNTETFNLLLDSGIMEDSFYYLNINYLTENNNYDKENILTMLSKHKKTKYIPIVSLLKELKENNWFENQNFNDLFNILMKDNFKSYNKLTLLKEIVHKIMYMDNNYTEEEFNALVWCKVFARPEEDFIEECLNHIDNKEKLNKILKLFDYKNILLINLLDKSPEQILEESDNSEIEDKKLLELVESEIDFFTEITKISFLVYFKNINDDIIYEQIQNSKNKIEKKLTEENFADCWNATLDCEFFQKIILKKNIELF